MSSVPRGGDVLPPPKPIIHKVIDIFLDADVHAVPSYNEVRDEFEILDFEICVTDDMIFQVEMNIAKHLDEKFPSHTREVHINEVMLRWTLRNNIRPPPPSTCT
jgi:hypothetical protein